MLDVVKIVTIGMDGGSENMRGVNFLIHFDVSTEDNRWLKEEECTFINPADLSRGMPQVLCSMHNSKCARN